LITMQRPDDDVLDRPGDVDSQRPDPNSLLDTFHTDPVVQAEPSPSPKRPPSPSPKAQVFEDQSHLSAIKETRESASLTGMHIAIILSVPSIIFVSIAILMAFKKAREDDPTVTFKDWMQETVRDYANFTYMQICQSEGLAEGGVRQPRPEVIVHSGGSPVESHHSKDRSKKMQGMSLSKKKEAARPQALAKKGPPAPTSSGRGTNGPAPARKAVADDWDDWGTDEN